MSAPEQSNTDIDGLHVAMLGTTDGDFISPDSEIPIGEAFRLASDYIAGVIASSGDDSAELVYKITSYLDYKSSPNTVVEEMIPALIAALDRANAKAALLEAATNSAS